MSLFTAFYILSEGLHGNISKSCVGPVTITGFVCWWGAGGDTCDEMSIALGNASFKYLRAPFQSGPADGEIQRSDL